MAARRAEYDAPGWLRLHFEGADHAIGRRDGRRVIAELRHDTVQRAVAPRPLSRAYPADPDLAAAATTTFVVRDQTVREAVGQFLKALVLGLEGFHPTRRISHAYCSQYPDRLMTSTDLPGRGASTMRPPPA